MSKIVKTLDSTSGALFMAGLVSGKLRYLPIPFFSSISSLISLGFYLTGYLVWLITCPLYAQQSKMPDAWFGFLAIRQQHFLAATIGLIAISLCLAALALPVLSVVGSWLFAISNLFWNIAEYHRFRNPPEKNINPNYSHQRQAYYLSYATLATMVSIMTATMLTASFFFAAIPMVATLATVVTLASTLTCIAAFYFLYKSFTCPKYSIQPNQTQLDVTNEQELTSSSSYTPILQRQINDDQEFLLQNTSSSLVPIVNSQANKMLIQTFREKVSTLPESSSIQEPVTSFNF